MEMVIEPVVSASVKFLLGKIECSDVGSYLRGKKGSGFDGLLEKLEITFLSLAAVLADAEQKQIRNPGVEKWLDKLQDVVDDAEDLFDDIEYDALELKVKAKSRTGQSKVRNFFSTIFNSTDRERKMKMEDILGRLETFAKQINALGLEKGVGEKLWRSLPSTSLIESEVYGRDHDKDAVMELLMSDDEARQETCVIPIVGMGGVGKTTLAQEIFNDDEVKEMFELKVWVCVSDEFDVCRVTKSILAEADASNVTDFNLLQDKLKEKLTGKKFLIVLDDVWNENYVAWNELKKPFKDGTRGSKIIVTTRSENVASIMGTVPTHHLKHLRDEECWKIFTKHASNGVNGDFTSIPDLERIGWEITKKCKGLPLAATTLGGLLRSTLDVGKWERIAKSEIWELTDEQSNILPALRLSYHYLPSHLKRCFAYCSIFPKDYKFQKDKLVLFWMAENLLEDPKTERKMEEVGYEYFNDLVSRSFFQYSSTNKSCFMMHDLMVDLAKFVSRKKFFVGEEGKLNEIVLMNQARHIAYDKRSHQAHEIFKSVSKATNLRTFLPLIVQPVSVAGYKKILVHDLLKLRCLRCLSLSGYHDIRQLPKSIGELRHLRYLDLSYTSLKLLPKSLSRLYNLQTLKLSACRYLAKLPKGLHRLLNLRYLDVEGSSVAEMPTKISNLKSLQKLSHFFVGKNSGAKIGELGELSDLRGKLSIRNLQNVVKVKDDAWAGKLRDKKHLEELELNWKLVDKTTDELEHERDVLDHLLPNTALKKLIIQNNGCCTFPKWLGDQSFCNLVDLFLINCQFCQTLPPLGLLPSLKNLSIVGFDAIETVGLEFYGASSSMVKPFASLESLVFYRLSNLKEWSMPIEVVEAFPKLRQLSINHCQKLTRDLPCLLPSLINLHISDCPNLASSLPLVPVVNEVNLSNCKKLPGFQDVQSFSCLQILEIYDCDNLEFPLHHTYESLQQLYLRNSGSFIRLFPLDYFPHIRMLSIEDCQNLESFSLCESLKSLSFLCIKGCSNFTLFPSSNLHCPILNRLEIRNCEKLKFLPDQLQSLLPSLQQLDIITCPELESFPISGLPFSLFGLKIVNCNKLTASRKNWNLQALPSLTRFSLQNYGCEDMKSFPEEGLLPTTITSLSIGELDCLKSLDQKGFQELASLKELYISHCPNLQTIPEEGLPTTLKNLSIIGCPLLGEKCGSEKGEYWNTIAHIPYIFVSDLFDKQNHFITFYQFQSGSKR